MSNICTNCLHWIGEPISHCELGPNQYPSCLRASIEALEQEAVCLYRVEVFDRFMGMAHQVGEQYVVASSRDKALRVARPHWDSRYNLVAHECAEEELQDYLDY